jgi:hypothetical protein
VTDLETQLCQAAERINDLSAENELAKASIQKLMAQNQKLRAVIEQLARGHSVQLGQARKFPHVPPVSGSMAAAAPSGVPFTMVSEAAPMGSQFRHHPPDSLDFGLANGQNCI